MIVEYLGGKFFHKLTFFHSGILSQYSNSVNSVERLILWQMFVKAVCTAMCLIVYTCDNGSENTIKGSGPILLSV